MNDVTGDDFDWLRLIGSTVSTYTGPAVDHTTLGQNGKLLSDFLFKLRLSRNLQTRVN